LADVLEQVKIKS